LVLAGLLAQGAANATAATVIETPAASPLSPAPVTTAAPAAPAPAPAAGTNAPAAKPAKKKDTKKKSAKPGGKKKAKPSTKKPAAKAVEPREVLKTTPLISGAGTVIASHVNVRGQAGLKGEVVGHLQQGDAVTVIEEITLKSSGPDEPNAWAKIALPASVHTWINSGFVDASKTVSAKRLNLRGGPGENYSVLGRLEKGDAVKEITTKGDWMEIEAPTNAYGFVAAVYLKQAETPAEVTPAKPLVEAAHPAAEKSAEVAGTPGANPVTPAAGTPAAASVPASNPPPVIASITPPPASPLTEVPAPTPITVPAPTPRRVVRPPTAPPVAAPTEEVAAAPGPVVDTTPAAAPPAASPETTPPAVAPVDPATTAGTPAPAAPDASSEVKPDAPAPPRIVQREGVVRGMTSIQAPSHYVLVALDSKRNIDYLYTSSTNVDLGRYKGAHVIVVGEEGLDERWGNTPVIDIHRLIVLKDAGN